MAMIGKESFQIDLKDSVLVFTESDGTQQPSVRVLTFEVGTVDTAEIDEVQCTPSHDKKGFKITAFRILLVTDHRGDIIEESALCGQLKLTDAHQLLVHRGGICQELGAIGHVAFFADFFLRFFRLNGKYF